MDDSAKQIVIPVDGSKNSMRSFDYLDLIFGAKQNVAINLLHMMPALPPISLQPAAWPFYPKAAGIKSVSLDWRYGNYS